MGNQALQAILTGTSQKVNLLADRGARLVNKRAKTMANFKSATEDFGKTVAKMEATREESELEKDLELIEQARSGALVAGQNVAGVLGDIKPTTHKGRMALAKARMEAVSSAQAELERSQDRARKADLMRAQTDYYDAGTLERSRPDPEPAPKPLSPSAMKTAYGEARERAYGMVNSVFSQMFEAQVGQPGFNANEALETVPDTLWSQLLTKAGIAEPDQARAKFEIQEDVRKRHREAEERREKSNKIKSETISTFAKTNSPAIAQAGIGAYLMAVGPLGKGSLQQAHDEGIQSGLAEIQQIVAGIEDPEARAAVATAAEATLREAANKQFERALARGNDFTPAEKAYASHLEEQIKMAEESKKGVGGRVREPVYKDGFLVESPAEKTIRESRAILDRMYKLGPGKWMPESPPTTTPTAPEVPSSAAAAPSSGSESQGNLTAEEAAELAALEAELFGK